MAVDQPPCLLPYILRRETNKRTDEARVTTSAASMSRPDAVWGFGVWIETQTGPPSRRDWQTLPAASLYTAERVLREIGSVRH
jgi:hypothetical protein